MDTDQPRQRIGAVHGALRTAQDLDLLRVEECRGHADAREIDLIDEKPDRGVGSALVLIKLAYAAQLKVTRSGRSRRPVEVGYEAKHVLEVLHPGSLERMRVQYCDARWKLFDGLPPQARVNDNLLQRRLLRGRHRLERALRTRGRNTPQQAQGKSLKC